MEGVISSDLHCVLDLLVDERYHSGESATHDIGHETLVKSLEAFVFDDVLDAMKSALVDALVHGFL